MNKKQKIALVAPIVLIAFMYLVYRLLATTYGDRIAWYAGFWIYWVVWGAGFSLLMLGKEVVCELIRPRKPDGKVLLLVALPLVMAIIFRIITGTVYAKANTLWVVLLTSTAFGNGFFEEVLWRGVYLKLFPRRIFFSIIWPAFWFALWHYLPGSLSPNPNTIGLVVGAGIFGLYLGFLARKTGTIWWPVVAHAVGGIIMVM